eukprot:TRINITY_DN4690_c1_g1_i1.p1 TRINITY_DN4690_c1_g1~~TRINITY_DN4690_c1_g1_i1.p1  ORF type:complete len:136 (+),score=29.79 TRINITY_DN4690_c1_g1_i1:90-497(+)
MHRSTELSRCLGSTHPPEIPITIVSPSYVKTNIRENSFGPKDFEPNYTGMMSPERCAELIMDAADQGKRKVILTLTGKLAVAMRPFFPDLVDSFVRRKALASPPPPQVSSTTLTTTTTTTTSSPQQQQQQLKAAL